MKRDTTIRNPPTTYRVEFVGYAEFEDRLDMDHVNEVIDKLKAMGDEAQAFLIVQGQRVPLVKS